MVSKTGWAYLEVTFAVLVWGASFVATKIALQDISPPTVVWLRFAMGIVVLALGVTVRHQWRPLQWADVGYLTLLGFLGITFHQWLQSTGLLTAQATTTSWIVATTPIFMALLGWVWLKEKLNWLQVCGIALAAIGVLLVVSKGDWRALSAGRLGTYGDFLILISAPNWAIFSALSRRGLAKFPAAWMVFYVMLFGWGFTTLQMLGGYFAEITQLSIPGWLGIVFLGVFCSGLAYIFWYDALQRLPIAQVGAFVYLEPFVTVLVAWALLSEVLILASLLGGLTILLGVWLVQRKS